MGTPLAKVPEVGAEYEVKDHSLLVPVLKRLLWSKIVPHIPDRVSANTLTLGGTILSALAFALTVLLPASRLTCGVVAVLVFGYLTLDNIDGAHARRTQTSSPLGEFLDHWLDALNSMFLYMGAIHMWSIPAGKAVAVMSLAVLSYTMTFWEQRATGRIHMGMLGNVEGIVAVVLFYLAGLILGPGALIHTEVLVGITVIDLFWLSAVASTLVTAVGPLVRVRARGWEVVEICAPVLALVLWFVLGEVSSFAVCHVLLLLNPALAGRMLIARTTQRGHLRPDRFLLGAIIAGAALSVLVPLAGAVQAALTAMLLAYAITTVTLDFFLTVRRLSEYLRPGELLSFARF